MEDFRVETKVKWSWRNRPLVTGKCRFRLINLLR